MTSAYEDRINRVCDFIEQHIDEDLSLERLSQVACFSKYHFHRQFAEYKGVNLYRYIQLVRLKRASYQLAFQPESRVIDVALDAGFENPESFSRAFKKVFGQTPTQFRAKPEWESWRDASRFSIRTRTQDMQVNIVDFEETKVAVYEHLGSPGKVNDSAAIFIQWRKESGLSPVKTCRTFGVPFHDPGAVPPEEFRFDICGSVDRDVPPNPQGVINKVISGGRCAVLRHEGSLDNIAAAVHYLYGEWLPESGEELRDFPCYFHYLNLIPDVAEHELLTDIYLPLR